MYHRAFFFADGSVLLVPLLKQPFTAGFDIISHYIDTVKTAYRKERVFFIFKRTATVFRLYDRKFSCKNFGKKIARSAGGFYVPTDFDTKGKALSGAKAAGKGLKRGLPR